MEDQTVRSKRPNRSSNPTDIDSECVVKFKTLHEHGYRDIDSALTCDEQGERAKARTHYQHGISYFLEALSIWFDDETARQMHSQKEKMVTLLEYAQKRVKELSEQENDAPLISTTRHTALPSYSQAMSEENDKPLASHNAEVLLEITDVQIFFITAEGYVSTPSYPDTLQVCKFSLSTVAQAPEYFLRVGTWSYPLLENISPAFQESDNTYVFPDVTSTVDGTCVGIIFNDFTPQEEIKTFEYLIQKLCAVRHSEQEVLCPPTLPPSRPPPPFCNSKLEETESSKEDPRSSNQEVASGGQSERLSSKISSGITAASHWISWGLENGSEKLSKFLSYGGEKIRNHLQPVNNDARIDDSAKRGVAMARTVTHNAVAVSAYVVKALGDATVKLGKLAAPHIKAQAKKILPEKIKQSMISKDQSGQSKLDGVLEVAEAGVKGFGVVYLQLEEAAKALGRTLAKQTSATVSHRFGSQAGGVTEDALFTVGNALMTTNNVKNLGPKAIAKRAAKDTAQALLENESEKNKENKSVEANNKK